VKNRIILIAFLISLPAALFAGTLFEDEKKTSDPYVASRGGFNSLFVNPAGAAGQSGFEMSVNMGVRTTSNDVKLIMAVSDMAMSMGSSDFDDVALADASQTFSDLYDSGVINENLLDAIFEGTTLDPDTFTDWDDPAAVQAEIESGSVVIADVEANLDVVLNGNPGDPQYDDFYAGLPGEVSMDTLASFKTGFLIKGFGLGVYDFATAVAFMDPTTQEYGLETIYNELGVIAGGGFHLMDGKLAVGVSGNYGVLMRNASPIGFDTFDSLINGPGSINYGYSWGVDAGAIWRPTPALGIGVVFNDIIGYTQTDTPYTADGFEGFINDNAIIMDGYDYEFTMDMDAGVSWQPDWRFVKPSLNLDVYNAIGYGRAVIDNNDDFEAACTGVWSIYVSEQISRSSIFLKSALNITTIT
jgi:hypothetical protein